MKQLKILIKVLKFASVPGIIIIIIIICDGVKFLFAVKLLPIFGCY